MARGAISEITAEASTDELLEQMASFYADPLGFVYFAFPWLEPNSELHDESGPDDWQIEFLVRLGEAVTARKLDTMHQLGAYLAGAATGHGTGKSALVAWIILWLMSTRVDPNIVVTANTLGQLSGKTWRELAKWHRLAINGSWFHWTATRLIHKSRPETHYASAVPWSKDRSEAFAGTHGRDVLLIFDEASGIDDVIWEVAEGALTTAGAIWLVFGNTTRNTGRFRECFRRFRHRWDMLKVDARTAKKANLPQLQAWLEDYGEDSDFFRIRVRAEFPRSASTQLIGPDLVESCQRAFQRKFGDQLRKAIQLRGPGCFADRDLDDNPLAPKIFCLDVARFGQDQTVLGMRQGRVFVVLEKWRNLDAIQVAKRVAPWIDAERPDQIFVDGVGYGAGVIDILRQLGYEIEDVNSGLNAIDVRKFFNRRIEMWWAGRDWLKNGGMIDHLDKELLDDLTSPEYGYAGRETRVQLESKDDMRGRGLPSPDTGDALMMSFFMPVAFRVSANTVAAQLARAGQEFRGGQYGGVGQSWMSF